MPGAGAQVLGINVLPNDGAVLVVLGQPKSGAPSFSLGGLPPDLATAQLLSEFVSIGIGDHAGDLFGTALTSGDFNGDGRKVCLRGGVPPNEISGYDNQN